jgi:hypothetical protein
MKRITILSVIVLVCFFVVSSPLLAMERPNILLNLHNGKNVKLFFSSDSSISVLDLDINGGCEVVLH